MKILVTGALGYIGSVLVEVLKEREFEVITLDGCHEGRAYLHNPDFELDLKDHDLPFRLEEISEEVEHVVHLAGFAYVKESFNEPMLYYGNNVLATINLLNVMNYFPNCDGLTFASSCSVYGNCQEMKDESGGYDPQSPYAMSKVICEQIIRDYTKQRCKDNEKFYSTIFRFFNVAGATAHYGDYHTPETHIIPNLIRSAIHNEEVNVFNLGEDIREYVHVCDVCDAIISSIYNVCDYSGTHIYNLGGVQSTTHELAHFAQEFFGKILNINYLMKGRDGDVHAARSCCDKVKTEFCWKNERSTIPNMFRTQTTFYENKMKKQETE